jgi:hypothetical protein
MRASKVQLHARRRLRFDTFDDALAEVERLSASEYERLGVWNLAQMCDHLADAIDDSVRGYSFRMPWLARTLIGPLALRYVLKTRSIPVRAKMPKRLEPRRGVDLHGSVARLRAAIRNFQTHSGPFAPHPLFGTISSDVWRQVHLVHIAHHLGFLVRDQQ